MRLFEASGCSLFFSKVEKRGKNKFLKSVQVQMRDGEIWGGNERGKLYGEQACVQMCRYNACVRTPGLSGCVNVHRHVVRACVCVCVHGCFCECVNAWAFVGERNQVSRIRPCGTTVAEA